MAEIRALGAECVVIGNGSAYFAKLFREEYAPDMQLLIDPELRAYRAAGLKRGRVEMLSPRLPKHIFRAWRNGFRQGSVQGDAWQLGGVFVIQAPGKLTYQYISREAGDHPPVEMIIQALAPHHPAIKMAADPSRLSRYVGKVLSWLVDPTVVFSFDKTGFAIHSLLFKSDDVDVDMSGKRCLISGGNSGIGYESALALADLGAEVVLLCRNQQRGEEAAERIRQQTANPKVSVEIVDIANLSSVAAVAQRLRSKPVDVLIHNAGVLPEQRIETPEGFELTFATHVLGSFALTNWLIEALKASSDPRVIWVSSGGMYTRKLNLNDPNWTKRPLYDGLIAYAETKRSQVVLAKIWAEKLPNIGFYSMHPGWADTPSVRSSIPRFYRITKWILRTPAQAADTVVWLATYPHIHQWNGRFFFDRKIRRTHLLPCTSEDEQAQQDLWTLCEKMSEKAIGHTKELNRSD
jgi:NAD(P)-dependent dehydrogenase (short-subunit alcohol dehydrogenase family)